MYVDLDRGSAMDSELLFCAHSFSLERRGRHSLGFVTKLPVSEFRCSRTCTVDCNYTVTIPCAS